MSSRRRYKKREQQQVIAVRLALDTDGFRYHKWGADQTCKPGDWLVDNAGDVYTIDASVFARTYRERSPGVYEKVSTVWAEQAKSAGFVETIEGRTHYEVGDYVVVNGEDESDVYAVSANKFRDMYEEVED